MELDNFSKNGSDMVSDVVSRHFYSLFYFFFIPFLKIVQNKYISNDQKNKHPPTFRCMSHNHFILYHTSNFDATNTNKEKNNKKKK